MKKRLIALIIAAAMIAAMVPAMMVYADESAGEAPDYSKAECWYQIPEIKKDVDTFFVYPTEYMASNEGDPDYAPLDNAEMIEGVKTNYPILASVYEDSTNVFMPYYRQAGMTFATEEAKKTGDPRSAFATVPYADITAALDYYFENYNNGRPFIIAGHSQGSGIVSLVLKDYFREHPDYYGRMIAAYAIGFSITKDYLEENTHLKFAAGESDTGVIISWNTEGPKNVEENASNVVILPNAISINPLNWKLDETYAPASENLGSRILNEESGEYEIKDIGADAKVILDRGSVLTNADAKPVEVDAFGPQSYHNGDYALFYNNIKDNVAKRIAAYKSKNDAQTKNSANAQPATKTEETATEEELINGGQIFTGSELTLYDPDTGEEITLKELSQGGWANEETGVIYTQEDGGGDHFYGDDGSVLVTEWLYQHSGEESSAEEETVDDKAEEDSNQEND